MSFQIFIVMNQSNEPQEYFSCLEKAQEYIDYFNNKKGYEVYYIQSDNYTDPDISAIIEADKFHDLKIEKCDLLLKKLENTYKNLTFGTSCQTIRCINYDKKLTIDINYSGTGRIASHDKTGWTEVSKEEVKQILHRWNMFKNFE